MLDLGPTFTAVLIPAIIILLFRKVSSSLGLGKMGLGFIASAASKMGGSNIQGTFQAIRGAAGNSLLARKGRGMAKRGFHRYSKARSDRRSYRARQMGNYLQRKAQVGQLSPEDKKKYKAAEKEAKANRKELRKKAKAERAANRLDRLMNELAVDPPGTATPLTVYAADTRQLQANVAGVGAEANRLTGIKDSETRKQKIEEFTEDTLDLSRTALGAPSIPTPLSAAQMALQVNSMKNLMPGIDASSIKFNTLGLPAVMPLDPSIMGPPPRSDIRLASNPAMFLDASIKAGIEDRVRNIQINAGPQAADNARAAMTHTALTLSGAFDPSTGEMLDMLKAHNIDVNKPDQAAKVQKAIDEGTLNLKLPTAVNNNVMNTSLESAAKYALQETTSMVGARLTHIENLKNTLNETHAAIKHDTQLALEGLNSVQNTPRIESIHSSSPTEIRSTLLKHNPHLQTTIEASIASLKGAYAAASTSKLNAATSAEEVAAENARTADIINDSIEQFNRISTRFHTLYNEPGRVSATNIQKEVNTLNRALADLVEETKSKVEAIAKDATDISPDLEEEVNTLSKEFHRIFKTKENTTQRKSFRKTFT